MSVKVGIIGAASLSTGRMLGFLLEHPDVEVAYLGSSSSEGEPIHTQHPHLRGLTSQAFGSADDFERQIECDLLFLTRPSGMAFEVAQRLLEKGKKVIDLSADFRLKDAGTYESAYGLPEGIDRATLQPLLARAVYGLAEINAEAISGAQLIANPGCYPTGVLLGLAPIALQGRLPGIPLVVDSFSGISGAGREPRPGSTFMQVFANLSPYNTGSHRHGPEIEQELSRLAKSAQSVFLNPHVLPVDYGILTNIFMPAPRPLELEDIYNAYVEFYKPHPFVRVLEPERLPQLQHVRNTNFCDIGIYLDSRTEWLRISTALDNTIKGAGGQAIQCMNLMLGLAPTAGLPYGKSISNAVGAS